MTPVIPGAGHPFSICSILDRFKILPGYVDLPPSMLSLPDMFARAISYTIALIFNSL